MHRDVNPKKFLGQHFLIDDNISKKIVEAINFKKFKKVIEIGPGKVLSGLVKRIDRNVELFQVNNMNDLNNLTN